jgi:hypothetical protein
LGIPLGGQPDKHRQLARQVGERIEDPLANSMALFKFSSPVLPEGMTFIFGSWVCVANGAGGFRRHTIDVTIKPKMLTARLDEFIDNLDESLFNGSARETEAETNDIALSPASIALSPASIGLTERGQCSGPLRQSPAPAALLRPPRLHCTFRPLGIST